VLPCAHECHIPLVSERASKQTGRATFGLARAATACVHFWGCARPKPEPSSPRAPSTKRKSQPVSLCAAIVRLSEGWDVPRVLKVSEDRGLAQLRKGLTTSATHGVIKRLPWAVGLDNVQAHGCCCEASKRPHIMMGAVSSNDGNAAEASATTLRKPRWVMRGPLHKDIGCIQVHVTSRIPLLGLPPKTGLLHGRSWRPSLQASFQSRQGTQRVAALDAL